MMKTTMKLPTMKTMKLPDRALALISEYSKPVTHPYWRCGTQHGYMFKQSRYMIQLSEELKYKALYHARTNLQINFGINILHMIENDKPFNEIIQQYGENIIKWLDNSNIITKLNFYSYIKDQLKQTRKFNLMCVYSNTNHYFVYEWS